jgi:Tol biopolymer transport system component
MKRCPECRRDYYDDSMLYCLDDGTALLEGPASGDEAATAILSGRRPNQRIKAWVEYGARLRGSRAGAKTFADHLLRIIEQYPAWSPDGKELAFSREESGLRSIFIKDLSSGDERRITNSKFDDIQASWSPDGRTILFVRSIHPGRKLEPGDVFGLFLDGNIWSVDVETQKEALLIQKAFNPEYSPDGKQIACDASWAGPRRIWAVDNLGHNPQQLTSDSSEGVNHVRPRWSPDGTRIVFQNIERTKFDIRVFDLITSSSVWVTNDPVQDLNPVWSPTGEFIYFSSYRGGGINIWRAAILGRSEPGWCSSTVDDRSRARCRDRGVA